MMMLFPWILFPMVTFEIVQSLGIPANVPFFLSEWIPYAIISTAIMGRCIMGLYIPHVSTRPLDWFLSVTIMLYGLVPWHCTMVMS